MRSNTSDTPNTQAAHQSPVINKLLGTISKGTKKAATWLTLGIAGKQWLASVMICAMLSPVFALPVRAASEMNAYRAALINRSDASRFEPVNEPLPIWKEAWMNVNVRAEAWLTTTREVNLAYKDIDDKDAKDKDKPKTRRASPKEALEKRVKTLDVQIQKEKPITVGQTIPLVAVSRDEQGKIIDGIIPAWTSSNPDILKIDENGQAVALKAGDVSLKAGAGIAEKEITVTVAAADPAASKETVKEAVAKKAAARMSLKSPKLALDIPPEQADRPILVDEPPVLVSPGGNLGNPIGQTAPPSNTPAAALRMKERAGIGNFSFELPVAALPGRGISASVGLSYNSQLWTRSGSASSYQYTYNVDGNWLGPGFQIGYGYLDAYASGSYLPNNLILTSTDGTRHQLDLTSAISGHAVYDSSDGSFMKGDASYDSNNAITNLTVTYTDGTKVLYGGANPQNRRFPTRITDIQGNYILITYLAGDQVGKIASVEDTLNRDMVFHYDTTTEQNLISVTVPGYNNSSTPRQTIRFYYESLTLQAQNSQAQNRFTGTITAPTTVTVLKYVYYPGSKTGYRYDYSAAYGMIYKVTRLDGMQVTSPDADTPGAVVTTSGSYLESATTHYDYPRSDVNPTAGALGDVPKYSNRTDDWIGRDTSAAAPNTYYNGTTGAGTRTMTVTSPNGSISSSVSIVDPGVWDDGLTKETSVTSSGRSIPWSKTTIEWEPSTATSAGSRNPRISKIIQTNEVGQAKATTFTYDDYDNPLTVREYDFDPTGQTTSELRRTETAYITSGDWITNRLVHLPLSIKKIVNNTTVVSRTDYEYDQNALTDRTGIIQHDSSYNSSNTQSNARGNVTKTTTFINPTNATVNLTDANDSVTTMNYDIAGNPVQATLNCCNLKTWTYDSTNYTYAYRTGETKGTDVQLTTSATFDFNTGLMRTSTDENNQVTTYDYESDTLRASKVTYPNGGYVQTEYSDKIITTTAQLSPGFVRQTTLLDTNKTIQSYSYYDGNESPIRNASQTPDGWSISATVYDPIGRPKKTYNPFYGSTQTDAVPSNAKWIEVAAYDGLDRATQIKLQDDSLVNSYYNEAAVTYTDPTSQTRQGTATRVNDQADKEMRRVVDALGRVIRVDEPDTTSNSLGSVSTPNQPTYYFYDGNDNLSKVSQSDGANTQERRFKYDALSRMTNEKQVEATATLDDSGTAGTPDPNSKWTKVFKYNAHGDIIDGYDARGVNTHFAYDGLNRVSAITFSDGTPQITYTYDQARSGYYNKGALTKTETAQGDYQRPDTPYTTTEFDYDKMGRVQQQRQVIGTQAYYLGYGYNLAGQLMSETYPSGKVISYNYDTGGRMASINDASRTYLSNLQYQGTGTSLSSMNLGNGATQTMTLNDRLQMTNQTLMKGSNVLQKYDYGYGQINLDTGAITANSNNGQLSKIESTIGTQKQWEQRFGYDAVGRLGEAREYRGDNINTLVYKQKFDYDRFGNLYRKNASNPTTGQANPLPYNTIEDADISKSTNRFTASTAYDNAGNVTQDTKFRSLNFSYDANGRVYKTSNTANTSQANSVYDASGSRVATQVDGVWTFFIYDIGGKLVSEYGGLAAMDAGGVKYVLQDWQGSCRAILSNTGFVQARMDYTAFGEEIGSGVGQRTPAQGFGAATNFSQKYDSTERDKATGLDHTWFRKNENRAGRWTSPDPYNGSMSLGDPQSFNRYAYVLNDPVNLIDPTGLYEGCIHEAMTKFLAKLAGGRSAKNADKLGHFAGSGKGGADSFKYSATNPINIVLAFLGTGPSVHIHFASEAKLKAEKEKFNGYMNAGDYQAAAFVLHSIEDVHGAHMGYHAPLGHAKDGTTPDRIIGDSKFLRASNEVLQLLSGDKDTHLNIAQINDLIDAVINGCGDKAKDFQIFYPQLVEGGGGGEIGYYTGGGMSDADWAFFMLDSLMSYDYETSVTVLD